MNFGGDSLPIIFIFFINIYISLIILILIVLIIRLDLEVFIRHVVVCLSHFLSKNISVDVYVPFDLLNWNLLN